MKANIWNIVLVIAFFLMCFLLMLACSPERRLGFILQKNPHLLKKDSSEIVTKKEGEVTAPGFVINNRISLDSLSAMLKANNNQPISIKTGKGELRYWINKAGELEQQCISSEQKIRYQYEERERFYQNTILAETKKEKIPWWLIAIVVVQGVLLLLCIVAIILLLIFRR